MFTNGVLIIIQRKLLGNRGSNAHFNHTTSFSQGNNLRLIK